VLANHRGFASVVGQVDEDRVELIEAAIRALDARKAHPGDDRLLARLTSLLASEQVFSEDVERRRALFARAAELADATGDVATRADVMVRLSLGNPHIEDPWIERAHGELAVALADEVGDPYLQVIARVFHAGAVLTFGDMAEVRRLTAESLELAAETSPNTQWVAQAQALKLLVGAADIPTLRAANDQVLALGEQLGEPDAAVWWGGVATHITFLAVGGIGDVAEAALAFGNDFGSGNPTWRLAAAAGLADLGRTEEARAILREPGMDPRTTVTSVFPYHPPTLTAQAAFLLEDEEIAAAVVEAMEPHAHMWTHYFLGTFGPVTAALGMAWSVLGEHVKATDLLDSAVARLEAEGLPVSANRIRYDRAQVLLRGGEVSRARASFEEVAAIADGHGADGLAARARAFAAEATGGP
jgi:hypothetical protein